MIIRTFFFKFRATGQPVGPEGDQRQQSHRQHTVAPTGRGRYSFCRPVQGKIRAYFICV